MLLDDAVSGDPLSDQIGGRHEDTEDHDVGHGHAHNRGQGAEQVGLCDQGQSGDDRHTGQCFEQDAVTFDRCGGAGCDDIRAFLNSVAESVGRFVVEDHMNVFLDLQPGSRDHRGDFTVERRIDDSGLLGAVGQHKLVFGFEDVGQAHRVGVRHIDDGRVVGLVGFDCALCQLDLTDT